MKKVFRLIPTVLLTIAVLLTVSCKKAQSNEEKYASAIRLLGQGKEYEAAKIFYSLTGYSDAKEQFDKIARTVSKNAQYAYPDGTKTEYKYEYKLDSKGRIISETEIEPDGTEYTTEYTYDDSKKTVTESRSYAQYTCEYTYDENGRTVREERSDDGNMAVRIYTYTYNDKGDVIKKVESSENGSNANTFEYTYDGSGKVVKAVSSFDSGIIYTSEYTYDSAGNRIKIAESTSEGDAFVYKYFYDGSGNIVKAVYTYPDGDYVNEYDDFIIVLKTCLYR